jgi:hypothetical protein
MTLWRIRFVVSVAAVLAVGGLANSRTPATKVATCGEYGTSVHFEDTPADAAKQAKKDEKLVMILHVSGHFENPEFT